MQNQKIPNPLPFILTFLFTDLILLGIILCLENYASFEGFIATCISSAWIVLLGIAFIALILSIILIKNYLALRNAIIESFMVLIFAFWFGIARIPIMNDGGANHYILFALGSFLLLAVNIGIQIDLLLAPSIKGFLTTDKKDREAAQTAAATSQPIMHPVEEQFQFERKVAKAAASVPNQQTTEKPVIQERVKKEVPTAQKVKPVSKAQTQQFRLEDLTEEQRKQFQEYQAKRRAARLAAQQQTRRMAAIQDQEKQKTPSVQSQPTVRKSETTPVKKVTQRNDGESLFF